MQFTVWVKYKGADSSTSWPEYYNEHTDTPLNWATSLIERFNASLREGEKPRQVDRVEITPNDKPAKHQWRKVNLVTLADGTDRYECEICGARAVRYGMGMITPTGKRNSYCKSSNGSYLKQKDKQMRRVIMEKKEPEAKIVRAVEQPVYTKRLRKVVTVRHTV